jgi:hypothetical protein
MLGHRNVVLRGLLTAAILLAPLTLFALQATPAHAQSPRAQVLKEKLAWLSQELALTDKQKQKSRPMVKEMVYQLYAVKGTPGLTVNQQKAKSLLIVSGTMQQIRSKVLNSDQRTKYDALKEQALVKMLDTRSAHAAAAAGAPQ